MDTRYFDPERVTRYFGMLEEILQACPIRIVAASYNKHPWPFRLQHHDECYRATFQWSNVRILDSGFNNPDVSNQDVIEKAADRGATEIVAKDYLAVGTTTADEAQAQTTESVREFIDLHDPDRDPVAWIPLQPPYADHYQTIRPIVESSHIGHRYMLGGLARAKPEKRIEQLLAFDDEREGDEVVHALGWGFDPQLVDLLRERPGLLDSIDNSTASKAAGQRGDRLLDGRWNEVEYHFVNGDMAGAIGGLGEMLMLIQAAHRLTDLNTDGVHAVHPDQSQLPGVADD